VHNKYPRAPMLAYPHVWDKIWIPMEYFAFSQALCPLPFGLQLCTTLCYFVCPSSSRLSNVFCLGFGPHRLRIALYYFVSLRSRGGDFLHIYRINFVHTIYPNPPKKSKKKWSISLSWPIILSLLS
jgi:hypothetical protein